MFVTRMVCLFPPTLPRPYTLTSVVPLPACAISNISTTTFVLKTSFLTAYCSRSMASYGPTCHGRVWELN